MSLKLLQKNKCHEGFWERYSHRSQECDCDMTFSVFRPPQAEKGKCPALFWLSGLTCTDQNFVQKAHVEGVAAELGMLVVAPDTSPRDCNIPGEDDSWDFGSGAGFYVDASQSPWSEHYRMYSYITRELYQTILNNFPVAPEQIAVSGHSMGGHGALTIALKNPGKFRSVSAFSPICNPTDCPWGQKALGNYLGDDPGTQREYDAVKLIEDGARAGKILVDQGGDDEFLAEQLKPERLRGACDDAGLDLSLNIRAGYDHSYFFIATFLPDHLRYHHTNLTL